MRFNLNIQRLRPQSFPLICLYLIPKSGHPGWMLHHKVLKYQLHELRNPKALLKAVIRGILWYGFYLWRSAGKMVRSAVAGKVVEHQGISRARQFADLAFLNIFFHLPFGSYYRDRLYLSRNRRTIHDRLYRSSLPHIHDYSNRGDHLASARQLMEDKQRFATVLEAAGFPCVQTLAVIGDPSEIHSFFRRQSVFCKPVTGSRSRDAFLLAYERTDESYSVSPINGAPISDPDALQAYLFEKCASRILVQELLTDHPAVAALSGSNDITTLRLVTGRFNDGRIQGIYAQIEFPGLEKTRAGRRLYRIYPLALPELTVSPQWKKTVPDTLKYDPGLIIPETMKSLLTEAVTLCIACHRTLFPIKSVGFDLALTPNGPVIIEANYNWNIEHLYRINAGPEDRSPSGFWLKELCDGK